MSTFLPGPATKTDLDARVAAGLAAPDASKTRVRHAGRRVLIVEDEAMIAGLIEAILSKGGWSVVGPVATLERALETIERERLDAALLDVRVNGHDAYAVADVLMRRRIPFVFVSGFARKEMPPPYRHCAYMASRSRRARSWRCWRKWCAGLGVSLEPTRALSSEECDGNRA